MLPKFDGKLGRRPALDIARATAVNPDDEAARAAEEVIRRPVDYDQGLPRSVHGEVSVRWTNQHGPGQTSETSPPSTSNLKPYRR